MLLDLDRIFQKGIKDPHTAIDAHQGCRLEYLAFVSFLSWHAVVVIIVSCGFWLCLVVPYILDLA
jgi:hypothetical protein